MSSLNFNTLQDFTNHLDQIKARFPLKVMGEKNGPTATMQAAMYAATQDPALVTPALAPWRVSNRMGARLDETITYSKIVAPSSGPNLCMGDIIAMQASPSGAGMVQLHSCNLAKLPEISVCPVFTEGQLTAKVLNRLRMTPVKPINEAAVRQGFLSNASNLCVAFPPPPAGPFTEPFVAVPHLTAPVAIDIATAAAPLYRLTYRALAFYQQRLGVLLGRDVENSDETRDF